MADSHARFAIMPARAFMDQAMTPALIQTLGGLCSCGDARGFAIIKHAKLAAQLGQEPRNMRRYIARLEALGYVRRAPRYWDDGSQVANAYFILHDALLPLERWRVAPPSVTENPDPWAETTQGGGYPLPRGEGNIHPGGRVIDALPISILDSTAAAAGDYARARATLSAAEPGDRNTDPQPTAWQALAADLIQEGVLAPTTNPRALALSLQASGLDLDQARLEAYAASEWNAGKGWPLTLARWRSWLAKRNPTENRTENTTQAGGTDHGEPNPTNPTNPTNHARPAPGPGAGPEQLGTGETEPAAAGQTPGGTGPARRSWSGGAARPGGQGNRTGQRRNRRTGGIIENSPEEWDAYARQRRAELEAEATGADQGTQATAGES